MLYTDLLGAISWTPADIVERYGELVTLGFTANAPPARSKSKVSTYRSSTGLQPRCGSDGIDPEIQARCGARVQPVGSEMRESSSGPGGDVGSGSDRGREPSRRRDPVRLRPARHPVLWARPDHLNHRNLGDRYYDRCTSCCKSRLRVRDARVPGPQRSHDGIRSLYDLHRVACGAPPHDAQHACLSMIVNGRLRAVPAAAVRVPGSRMRMVAFLASPHR